MATAHIGQDRLIPLVQNFSTGRTSSFRGAVAATNYRLPFAVFGVPGDGGLSLPDRSTLPRSFSVDYRQRLAFPAPKHRLPRELGA